LGRWATELDGLLSGNGRQIPLAEQLTLIRIFEELRWARLYDGPVTTPCAVYARRWSKERGESTAAAYRPR